jgi:glycosyltransferase involved in cell wall biosynthesis
VKMSRALLIAPRLPGTGFTGDRIRSQAHLDALKMAGLHVTLIGGMPEGQPPPRIHGADEVHAVPLERRRMPMSLVRSGMRGDPFQSALHAGPWSEALAAAGGEFDIVVWSLVRLWPHLRGRLPDAPVVLDYIDALAAAARQASHSDAALWRRLYWSAEAPRLLKAEREAGAGAALLLATTRRDASELPAGTSVFFHGVDVHPLVGRSREPIVAFSGRLMYRPNELAVKRLVDRIWPLVLRRSPSARLALGGADAPPWIRSLHGQKGIEVHSPVDDMCTFLREARVVVAPVELGLGTPNKLFEALEAGTPVVASAAVVDRGATEEVSPPARVAADDQQFADAVCEYLEDSRQAAEDGAIGRRFVELHADRRVAVESLSRAYRAIAEKR